MKPTKQLIRGLRETAHKLRNGATYDWTSPTLCNCGLLAQTLLDVDMWGLHELRGLYELDGVWRIAAKQGYCEQTGLPLHRVFQVLASCGLEQADYERIERLDNAPCGIFDSREGVAAWMDAQADELERRRIAERFEEGK